MASVRKRTTKAGQPVWAVLFRHGSKQASRTFDTAKKAERFRSLVDALGPDRALLELADERHGGVTLDELASDWFNRKARDLTPRAIADYRRDYTNWIAPHFGHRTASHITETDVQNWVDRDLAPLLSPKTVADRHALLHGIYAWASQRKRALVPVNPCTETDLPKRTKKPPKGLTLPEWLALKDAAYRVNRDAADLILFMASTGWRIGEATALMAFGVDDSGPRMFVTMTHVNRKGSGVIAGAKSDAGHRRISLSADAAAMVRRRLVGLGPSDYVFTNPHSPTGLWEPSTFRNRWWRKSVEAAGLADRQPTPHWLRHTHVMLCHAAGMTMAEIQRRLGHTDIRTTMNVYGRMIDDMTDDTSERLDALLTGRGLPVLADAVQVGRLSPTGVTTEIEDGPLPLDRIRQEAADVHHAPHASDGQSELP